MNTDTVKISTRCCIVGGGPAGIMLGYLLARGGVDVTVLEKWPDFFRDFRGDTIHPSTMAVLKELGLLEKFLALKPNQTQQVVAHVGGEAIPVADFSHLKVAAPFIAFIPQWDFLDFIADEARLLPNFRLQMGTECTGLIEENDRVAGVHARSALDGASEIRADLVIGADGRHSIVRAQAGLPVHDYGAPIDVLWFRLSKEGEGNSESFGYVDHGMMLVTINRDSYWQCAFIIRKGDFERIRAEGLEHFRSNVVSLVPALKEIVHEISDWEQVKLLTVKVDHLDHWHKPGVLCIGDAAHAMSPVGGVGINLAIQDAVAAANVLIPAFARTDGPQQSDLAAVQKRRTWPARATQRAQVFIHTHVLERILGHEGRIAPPLPLRLLARFPVLRRIPAYLIGIGVRPEHIRQ